MPETLLIRLLATGSGSQGTKAAVGQEVISVKQWGPCMESCDVIGISKT